MLPTNPQLCEKKNKKITLFRFGLHSGRLLLLPTIASSQHPIHAYELKSVGADERGRVEGSPLDEFLSADGLLGDVEAVGFAEEEEEVAMGF
jgi:hypothetical protein